MAKLINKSKTYIMDWADGCFLRPCVTGYIHPASDILHHDYPKLKCDYFNKIYAWDADSYEKSVHKHQNTETVDMVFGLDYGKMLMVEAKLDVQNVDNIKGEIEDKINHTRSYLVSSTKLRSIANPSIVLFSHVKFEQLSSKFRRLRSYKTDIKPMTISSFYKDYFEELKICE